MLYQWRLRLMQTRVGRRLARSVPALGRLDYDRDALERSVRRFAPGKSFTDIGCMWGIHGQYCFVAEEAGATRVVGVDVDLATPEFETTRTERGSKVEFVHGDIGDPKIIKQLGGFEVVFCSGVLYHHPSPYDLLLALRRITTETLILTTATIPEVPGLPQAAVYYPYLSVADRSLWDMAAVTGGRMIGISEDFQPDWGYANWFWGMSPSCVRALLETAGFKVTEEQTLWEFGRLFVCKVEREPIEHRLPEKTSAAN